MSIPRAGFADPLVFTEAAAIKVLELIREEEKPDLCLRVFVTGGGCSGFQYGFTFVEGILPGDTVIEKQVKEGDDEGEGGKSGGEGGRSGAVRLLVDPLSLNYLRDAEIDYKQDITGSQFVIRNPNAATTCGCGSSFSV